MPTIDRDGVAIAYEDEGPKDAAGPVILLSHGYTSTLGMWDGQVEALGDRHRIIRWDMRGHGASDYPEDEALYSEAHTVDDMAAILDACGVEKAVIGGLSLGGFMSLAFHVKYPERTAALALFDTGPGYRNDKARDDWNETARAQGRNFDEKGLDGLGSGAEVKRDRHRSAEGLARAARGMLAQVDARIIDSLPNIAVSTLVLVGAKDRPYLGATDYMANKIPGAKKVVIEDAGHASNIHQPEIFNEEFAKWLTSLA